MMYRLGLRLTLRSGREPFVRLVVTAVAVAIGVAIMLAVLADFHAFATTNNRPSWESTQGQALTKSYAAATNSELWNYSNDIYRGQTIERLDVAGLGPNAPVPPGISELPASGQYYASPALAALIRTVPADELGDRFPGRLIGTIGHQALAGPDELAIYVGYPPSKLAILPATRLVNDIATAAGDRSGRLLPRRLRRRRDSVPVPHPYPGRYRHPAGRRQARGTVCGAPARRCHVTADRHHLLGGRHDQRRAGRRPGHPCFRVAPALAGEHDHHKSAVLREQVTPTLGRLPDRLDRSSCSCRYLVAHFAAAGSDLAARRRQAGDAARAHYKIAGPPLPSASRCSSPAW